MEDRLAMLDGDHAPRGEARAVADAVDVVDDGRGLVARAQEVAVQRMRRMPVDRAGRGHQRLPEHLAAEDGGRADVGAGAAKQVLLELLELQLRDERLQRLRAASAHAACSVE